MFGSHQGEVASYCSSYPQPEAHSTACSCLRYGTTDVTCPPCHFGLSCSVDRYEPVGFAIQVHSFLSCTSALLARLAHSRRALESALNSQTAKLRDKAPGGLTGLTFPKQTTEQGPRVNLAQLSAVHIDADTLPALEKGAGKHVLRYLLACQRSRCDKVSKSLYHYTERLTISIYGEELTGCMWSQSTQAKVGALQA